MRVLVKFRAPKDPSNCMTQRDGRPRPIEGQEVNKTIRTRGKAAPGGNEDGAPVRPWEDALPSGFEAEMWRASGTSIRNAAAAAQT